MPLLGVWLSAAWLAVPPAQLASLTRVPRAGVCRPPMARRRRHSACHVVRCLIVFESAPFVFASCSVQSCMRFFQAIMLRLRPTRLNPPAKTA